MLFQLDSGTNFLNKIGIYFFSRPQPNTFEDDKDKDSNQNKENAKMLTDEEEDLDVPKAGKSLTFPTIDSPDIPPGGEKVSKASEPKEGKENEGEDDDEDSEKPQKKKMVKCQAPTYVPPEQRKFRPVSEIPEDDLTVKREVSTCYVLIKFLLNNL